MSVTKHLTYAVPDLHGRFDLLKMAYAAMTDHARGLAGLIVHLGDYVDRGPDGRRVVEFLMDAETVPSGWKRICLRGNHEDMMIAAASSAELCDQKWMPNGGDSTLISYGAAYGDTIEKGMSLIPSEHVTWMKHLRLMHIDDHRVFVHAGVNANLPLDTQDDREVVSMRYPNDFEDGHGERHVVHGHTPKIKGPLVYRGRTNIDTYAWATGRLVIGVFDDMQAGGAVEFLEVTGQPAPEEDL